jgi:SHS2 domain-containing protein
VIERIDHTSELELRLSAPSLAELLAEALRAVADEVDDDAGQAGATAPRERVPVAIDASGPDTLLVDLLNEAIFLMETRGFLPAGLEAGELEGGRLRGELVGRTAEDVRPLVKAATYHGLAVSRDADGWRGAVVLDV